MSLSYGLFLQNVLNFIFIALAVFMIVKAANAMMENARKKEEEAPAETPEPSKEELLLTEIRDVLKEMKQ